MLPLDDPRWKTYHGGYRVAYDASEPLLRLFATGGAEDVFDELWNELHHQGDVDQASYAALPHLLEFARQSKTLNWNTFGLIATIELVRPRNPDVAPELRLSYFSALDSIPGVLANHPDDEWNALLMQCATACIALSRGQREFGHIYSELSLEHGRAWFKGEFDIDPSA